ncbi:MAG: HDIG domain-containing metalloprotein [Promethearchaeota archaeon]
MKLIPSRKKALSILQQMNVARSVIRHSIAVCEKSLEIARIIKNKGRRINLAILEAGALLHDIGRTKTNSILHGVVGGQILRRLGICEEVVRIVETHVLGGISPQEGKNLGFPEGDFRPRTVEEKICCYADKLTKGSRYVTLEERFAYWVEKYGNTIEIKRSLERTKQIGEYLKQLMNEP